MSIVTIYCTTPWFYCTFN